MRISFLGLGAMGSRMATRLLDAGHDLTVWNRSPERAADLVRAGARLAASPREAAGTAELVLSMVYDDTASARVWLAPEQGALAGMQPGALGLECSTVSPSHVSSLHNAAEAAGAGFLDAPLAGSRPQAEAGTLVFLLGGSDREVARATPVLKAMGDHVAHVGGPGAGAAAKLMVNTLFAGQLAMLAELLGLLRRTGVDPERAFAALSATPVASPAVKAAGAAMLAGAFAPAAPLDLILKDLRLAVGLAGETEAGTPALKALAQIYAAASAQGLGALNVTAIARRYLPV